MSNPPVPSIPPISSVSDPNVRAILQSLATGWQVRNGQAGDGSNAFLTAADVGNTITNIFNNAANGSNASSSPGVDNPVIRAVVREVINSPEWNSLNDAVAIIQTPDWLNKALTEAVGSMFDQISVLAARLGEVSAAIGYQDQAFATNERAMVSSFKQIVAAYGGNTSQVTNLDTALATLSDTTATHTQQVAASISTAQSTATGAVTHSDAVTGSINGAMSAMSTLKTQLGYGGNHYVSGMAIGISGTSAGVVQSDVVFRADTFAIGAPSYSTASLDNLGGAIVPFTVKTASWTDPLTGTVYPPGVYMTNVVITNANIGNAAITNANIGNAAVDTLSIKNGAIGRGAVIYGALPMTNLDKTTYVDVASISVPVSGVDSSNLGKFIVVANVSVFPNQGGDKIYDIIISDEFGYYPAGAQIGTSGATISGTSVAAQFDVSSSGTRTFTCKIKLDNNSTVFPASTAVGCTMSILGAQR